MEQYGVRAQLHIWWALHALAQGEDPCPHVAAARRDVTQGLRLDPGSWWTLEALAELEAGTPFGHPIQARQGLARLEKAYPRDPVADHLRRQGRSITTEGLRSAR